MSSASFSLVNIVSPPVGRYRNARAGVSRRIAVRVAGACRKIRSAGCRTRLTLTRREAAGCDHEDPMAFTVGELSRLTGVTVRALHHYDEIGLVRPSQRTAAGYRLYDEADVLRLQQVLVL